ncbi:MAG TPA: hypothetical protein VH639_18515 [Bryobacteraceae bacterium]|jgi:hypothetical protein
MPRALFYPLGYPVEIVSGDEAALEAASDLWRSWPALFDAAPVKIQIEVHGGAAPCRAPRFSAPAGSLRFSSDEMNFAEFDPGARCGKLSIAADALGSGIFRHHFLEALGLSALDAVFFTPLHAACVSRDNAGILLCGDSGSGKSSLAYACARGGWTLVSDDAVHLAPGPDRIGVGGSNVIRLREPGALPTSEQTIEIDAAAQGLRVARSAPADQCIFLKRRPGPAAWREFPAREATRYFLKYIEPRETSRAARHLGEFLDSPPLLLEYEDVEDAVGAIEASVGAAA